MKNILFKRIFLKTDEWSSLKIQLRKLCDRSEYNLCAQLCRYVFLLQNKTKQSSKE